ncbi:MAG: hypothetical protein HFI93_06000 [Lachnospiraceae bacterium]|nr:hypothetical protein [Lachnospiraceae bacterium]
MKEERNYAGMDLFLFGYVGEEGTRILAREGWEKLAKRLPEDFLAGIRDQKVFSLTAEELRDETGAAFVRPLGEGGLLAALWELSREVNAGFCLDLKNVPIHQETIEVCEILGLNPYQLSSGGAFLVLSEKAGELFWRYRDGSLPARMVGRISGDMDKKIYIGEHVCYLNRPGPDELLRFRRENRKGGIE